MSIAAAHRMLFGVLLPVLIGVPVFVAAAPPLLITFENQSGHSDSDVYIGFVGGAWHGHEFAYNTAVVRVNTTVVHNTYVDNTIVRNNTVVNDRHVAYSGGPGGVNHRPTPEENAYSREQHVAPTAMQTQHGILAIVSVVSVSWVIRSTS